MVAHRLAQSARAGGRIHFVNGMDYTFNFPVASQLTGNPVAMEHHLAGITKALLGGKSAPDDLPGLDQLLKGRRTSADEKEIAASLKEAGARGAVILGEQAVMHPRYDHLYAFAQAIAKLSGATLGVLTCGANAAGAWLAGAIPHRLPGGKVLPEAGYNVQNMYHEDVPACVMVNVEPDMDGAQPGSFRRTVSKAAFVMSLTPYVSEYMSSRCDVLLPITPYSETSGTFVNLEGVWQSFTASVAPKGEARPAWKVLRVLANLLELEGFDHVSSSDVLEEVRSSIEDQGDVSAQREWRCPSALTVKEEQVWCISSIPPYAVDAVVRHADALQHTADAVEHATAAMSEEQMRAHNVGIGDKIKIHQGDFVGEFEVNQDDRVPSGCIHVASATPGCESLGTSVAMVTVERVSG